MIFTTSWDDGYASDLRIAEMLRRHGATGNFYIAPHAQHGQTMLTPGEIKELSILCEIGAHTLHHPRLSTIPIADAAAEIRNSKEWVEEVTGQPCAMFCYPYGDFNDAVRDAVMSAGFLGARTVEEIRFSATDRFRIPTSLHLYPYPWRQRFVRWSDLWSPLEPLSRIRSSLDMLHISRFARRGFQPLARSLFLSALGSGQAFFHLWGHAYEVDRYDLWDELDAFLGFVARHAVTHCTNQELALTLFPDA